MAITRELLEQQIKKADGEVKQAEANGNFALGFRAACQFILDNLPPSEASSTGADAPTGD